MSLQGKNYSISQVELIRLVCGVGDAKAREINKAILSDPALQGVFKRKASHAGLKIKIIREVDSASPSLWEACESGEVFLPNAFNPLKGGANKGGGSNKGGGKHKGGITIIREVDSASPIYFIGADTMSVSLFAANAPDLRRICFGKPGKAIRL